MNRKTRFTAHAALIGALYVVLTYAQNLIIPDSATWAIQFRASEALCILAFFTPAAVPGLTIGCLLFNLSYAAALPLDAIVGTAASFLATGAMWLTRKITIKGYPLPAMLMPALFNVLIVGWELTIYIGGAFWLNALYVALGEIIVLLVIGTLLLYVFEKRGLRKHLFRNR